MTDRPQDALQLILLRYVITYGRVLGRYSFREISYTLHEREFRQASNNATIGFNPYVSFSLSNTR
jgi:hypothetical protein